MPRTAKKQPVQTAAGQAYGVAGEQKAAMNEVPLPKTDMGAAPPAVPPGGALPPPAAPGGSPAPSPGGPPPGEASGDPMAAALAAAAQMAPPEGALDAFTGRPEEPITTGLPTGPGPGPEVLTMRSPTAMKPTPVADAFTTIAAANSSPALQQLADEARRRGV